jgi:hypothetical protein
MTEREKDKETGGEQPRKLTCTFCGRGRDDALAFFRPATERKTSGDRPIRICDRCIEVCHRRLVNEREQGLEHHEKQRFREWLDDSVTETLIRAIVDFKYRDALVEAFGERAELAAIGADEAPSPVALALLPAEFVRENRVLPWRIEQDHLVVAFYNPLHLLDIYDAIVRMAGMPIRPALIGRDALLAAIERHIGSDG